MSVCFFGSLMFSQQISIDDSFTAQQLIQDYLVQGCVEASNVNSPVNGSINGFASFAYFERGSSNFPFENGIMLSTGRAVSGGNGINTAVLNEGQSDWLTDPDLEAALGIDNTLNATAIEFDFVSISNQIQFNYIFASEEYFADFPCNYSDAFVFLIKEAGSSNPYTNIAVIPGTSTPVNTNTIHPEIAGFCPASYEEYFAGYNLMDTNYNGQTTILSAVASIVPNTTYRIKLIIADQRDKNYDSAVFIQGNSFNASVDLGDDVTTCSSSTVLDGNIQNPAASYSWFLNGFLVANANQPTYVATQSGTYTVKITIPFGGSNCVIEDHVEVTLNSTQTADAIPDFQLCDDPSGDGIEIFDLGSMDAVVLAAVPDSNYHISYHHTSSAAQNNTGEITAPIQNTSSPQTIYVRIEDIDNGCIAYANFNLVVNPLPSIVDPTELVVCDDAIADGQTEIDLRQKNDEITNGNSNLIVTYHLTQAQANSGNNPLRNPYTTTSNNGQVFVRVVDALTGCFRTTSLAYTVLDNPVINYEDIFIDGCDADLDGFANFDLTSIVNNILQGLTGVNVTFHESYDEAVSGENPIADETNYQNTVAEVQTLFIRVEDANTGCASVTSFEIHSNLLLTGTDIRNFSQCDEDNDGFVTFDLEIIALEIINGLEDVTITFYTTEQDQQNGTNALDPNVSLTPTEYPMLLYITLNSPTCQEVSQIELVLNVVDEFPPIPPVNYCDDDDDGFTSIDLHSFDAQLTGGIEGYVVEYFATQEDARNNANPLPAFYTNTVNPVTVYPKIISVNTSCGDVNPMQINVLPAPVSMQPNDVFLCDDDQDGMVFYDLTQVYAELVTNTSNLVFTFYGSVEDLEQNANPFQNVSNFFTGSREIYVKVANASTGCWTSQHYNLYVNTQPAFVPISNFRFCEFESNGFGDFIFSEKDDEILNGQTGKQVLYFLNENDANNRVNEINKDTAYQNTSNPQTIFVRVENLNDQDCYGVSSFVIEVGTNPEFNEPVDWFVCDDISNDATEIFDLNIKIDEITAGISGNVDVTFHTSQIDAEVGTNAVPLQFSNFVNPQQIYVRIDNGTICPSFTSFTLNVIQVAQASPAQPLTLCDDNYDGIVTFDLTLSEIEILDVRQDNIVVTYYETEDDLHNQTNAITNPSAYTNTSSPQTVFVRLTNTVSNCYLSLPLELIVNLPPAINEFGSIDVCDNSDSYFDLLVVNSLIVDNPSEMLITYHATASDAMQGLAPLGTDYHYASTNTTLYARIENATTHCSTTYAFQLVVRPLPIAHTANDLEDCDDDYDGLREFDLSAQDAAILGGQNPAVFSVTYHNTLQDAQSGANPLPEMYFAFDTETIYARVTNNNTGCSNYSQFNVIVHPKPVVDDLDQYLCLDNLPLVVSANTNNANDTYLWSTGETTPEIGIDQIGVYSVTVTTEFGCTTTREFNIYESEMANIEIVETVDFSDPNNITITISGIGDYLYQLDDHEPQVSNVFQNVGIGYHTVTVIDQNGCGSVSKEVLVLDFPKFMTPNDDGRFDTWHIIGVETLPGTTIYIYDRYGKQLAYLTANSGGWDGTYNGQKMPANDYWFVANVVGGGYNFQAKGHFALRR